MVAAGAQYLKVDSCCASQDHATAFGEYGKFRDALNGTGVEVWFSLCGWEQWYAPPDPSVNYGGGSTLGNSWRIAGDGSGWGPLTNCMNVIAGVAEYSGPGGWNDPDLLIGPNVYVGGQSDEQARAQFSMWCLFPANLIISQNVLTWSSYAFETYSNGEVQESLSLLSL
jgi:alpha-galactosidase